MAQCANGKTDPERLSNLLKVTQKVERLELEPRNKTKEERRVMWGEVGARLWVGKE